MDVFNYLVHMDVHNDELLKLASDNRDGKQFAEALKSIEDTEKLFQFFTLLFAIKVRHDSEAVVRACLTIIYLMFDGWTDAEFKAMDEITRGKRLSAFCTPVIYKPNSLEIREVLLCKALELDEDSSYNSVGRIISGAVSFGALAQAEAENKYNYLKELEHQNMETAMTVMSPLVYGQLEFGDFVFRLKDMDEVE